MASRRSWLFYVLLIFSFFLPAMASVPLEQEDSGPVIVAVLTSCTTSLSWLAPVIHLSTVIVLVLLATRLRGGSRIFDVHFAVVFTLLAFANNLAQTEEYGFAVITGNMAPMLVVALAWLWEAARPRNELVPCGVPKWRYWVVPLAILAFWFPMGDDLSPDFDPRLLLTSDYGITFCATVPVVVAVLSLFYPAVNPFVLRVTSLVGLVIGSFNGLSLFIVPGYSAWLFVLHIPLIVLSIYGLLLPRVVRRELPTQGSLESSG